VNMLKSMIANPIYQSYLSELFRGLRRTANPWNARIGRRWKKRRELSQKLHPG